MVTAPELSNIRGPSEHSSHLSAVSQLSLNAHKVFSANVSDLEPSVVHLLKVPLHPC